MEESRVRRYKEHRNSLMKEDLPVLETPPVPSKEKKKDKTLQPTDGTARTTISVSYDRIMENVKQDEEEKALAEGIKRKRTLKIVLVSVGALVLVATLVIVGIGVFVWW